MSKHRPVVFAFAVVLSTPAVGQTGTLLGPTPVQIPYGSMSKLDRARKTMHGYAECVVRRAPTSVEKYLKTFPGSKEANAQANAISVDECLSTGELSFNEQSFRGGVYDVLYRIKFRREAPIDFNGVPSIDYKPAGVAELSGGMAGIVALRQLADCTVRHGPAEARALIMSNIASEAEDAAFSAVVSHMSACLDDGSKLTFSKPAFRGAIGEVLYRLSTNAVGAQIPAKE